MYFHLAQEEENSVVHNFLQDLMETEVLDFGIVEDLKVDSDQNKKKWRDPSITMEVRHKQVKENRMMEEKRSVEQLARNMERERLQKQWATENSLIPKHHNSTQKKQNKDLQLKLKKLEARVHLLDLQCMHRHFTTWYSVILERRVRMGKAAALCDWRRQLRAWRSWRALVWARREKKEAERTEEELRQEHRRCQQAVESDRRRLLRRCLSDWRVWCQVEHHRKELLQQQEETRRKMAVLINAAASRKLGAEKSPPVTNPFKTLSPRENISHQDVAAAPESSSLTAQASEAPPTQAWQVRRRHAALSSAELQQLRQGQQQQTSQSGSVELSGGQFKHRHAALQLTVAEQKRLLKEQQEQIRHLQERQNILELRHEAEKIALLGTSPPGATNTCCLPKPNTETANRITEKPA
ncbi:coiled-coil domain-containing protein 191-like, partial [Sinocyclocheilus grahami]|uniref:coiled-coil domain-containing protein 191-like n=1 Tax=Sinocyclocheilus grahami TaxID=75366 RepID=UPI0007AD1527